MIVIIDFDQNLRGFFPVINRKNTVCIKNMISPNGVLYVNLEFSTLKNQIPVAMSTIGTSLLVEISHSTRVTTKSQYRNNTFLVTLGL